MYTAVKTFAACNGQITNWFDLHGGYRQGDPCSHDIYVICAEVLAHAIRQTSEVNIHLFNTHVSLMQCANNTTFLLDGSESSLSSCIHTPMECTGFFGLAINYEKSNAIWAGFT